VTTCSCASVLDFAASASAPELAARGRYPVGVRTIEIVHREQVDILHFDKTTGKAPLYDRPLTVEVWYPATIPPAQTEETTYQMPVPGGHGFEGSPIFQIADKALRDATPVSGARFPLVIVSHGYPGSRYSMTYLTANLGSKGYIVAAVDHTDSVFDALKGFEALSSTDPVINYSRLRAWINLIASRVAFFINWWTQTMLQLWGIPWAGMERSPAPVRVTAPRVL